MRLLTAALLAAVALLSGVRAEEDSNVLVLTTKTYDQALKDNKIILVEYYVRSDS
jgi:hypothetical protein